MEERNESLRREIISLLGHNITLNVETVQTAPFNGDPIPFCSFSCVKTHKNKFFSLNPECFFVFCQCFFGGGLFFFSICENMEKIFVYS